ncbi:hypothetical protein ACQEU6_39940 [Spirillospora sp. CA-108201]
MCGKRAFATREDAEAEMRWKLARKDNADGFARLPSRVQECENCDAFHITGATAKPAPAGKLRRRRQGGGGWK